MFFHFFNFGSNFLIVLCYNELKHILQNLHDIFVIYILRTTDSFFLESVYFIRIYAFCYPSTIEKQETIYGKMQS